MPGTRARAGRRSCWRARLWSGAAVGIALLTACFVASCVVIHQVTRAQAGTKLRELHAFHSGLACVSEGTSVTGRSWGCCPRGWPAFRSSCYRVSSERRFWLRSQQQCEAQGGHLLVINTEEEQQFIVQQLNESASYFLGLSDPHGTRAWEWIDGTPFRSNVKFWHPNEPNSPEERCGSIICWNGKWAWNDIMCDRNLPWICEMDKVYL